MLVKKQSMLANVSALLRRHRGKLLLLALIAVVAASPFLALCGAVAVDAAKERLNRRVFDSAEWKRSLAESRSDDPIRLRMVEDLLRRHPLTGLNRADTAALLGTPPDTGYFKEYDLVYWLGPERGFMSIDSEWLAIRYDDAGRVSEARLVRD